MRSSMYSLPWLANRLLPSGACPTRRARIVAALGGLLLLMGLPLQAAELTSISYVPLSGDRAELRLNITGDIPEPDAFAIDRPARLTLDLPGVDNALRQRVVPINAGLLNSVITAQASGKTRAVLVLTKMVPYRIERRPGQLVLRLNDTAVVAAPPPVVAPLPPAAPTSPSNRQAVALAPRPVVEVPDRTRRVTSLDFRRGNGGEGRLLIGLSDPAIETSVSTRGGKVLVELRNAVLPPELAHRYDAIDFGTPVVTFDAAQRGSDTRIVITTEGVYDQLAYQADDLFVVELQRLTLEQEKARNPYSGQRINLNFQNVEVRQLLQVLADVADVNIVVSDTVVGNITLRLIQVPWDQALDIILRTKGLDKRETGNVIYVGPLDELASREQREREAVLKAEELAPLRSEVIQVNYATAADLVTLLQTQNGGGGGGGSGGSETESGGFISTRGSISSDARTNTILVQDTAEKLAEIRRVVDRLDVPVQQVLIESRIVVANSDYTHELGVRFGATTVQANGSDGLVGISGSSVGLDGLVNDFLSDGFPVGVPSLGNRTQVNLPSGSQSGRLALAILGSDYLLDLELSALQAEGGGEIISNPRLITTDQQEALIQQGVEIPFLTTSENGTTVEFKEAVLQLRVRPQITPDERIIMDLDVTQDAVGQLVPSGLGGFIPSIDTRQIQTQVLVENGETVVLGGVYEVSRSKAESKVPVLGDLPLIGGLFRTRRNTDEKAELLIFISPRILKDGLKVDYSAR